MRLCSGGLVALAKIGSGSFSFPCVKHKVWDNKSEVFVAQISNKKIAFPESNGLNLPILSNKSINFSRRPFLVKNSPYYTVAILNICTVKSFGKEDFPPRRFYWHDAGDEVAVVGQPRYL